MVHCIPIGIFSFACAATGGGGDDIWILARVWAPGGVSVLRFFSNGDEKNCLSATSSRLRIQTSTVVGQEAWPQPGRSLARKVLARTSLQLQDNFLKYQGHYKSFHLDASFALEEGQISYHFFNKMSLVSSLWPRRIVDSLTNDQQRVSKSHKALSRCPQTIVEEDFKWNQMFWYGAPHPCMASWCSKYHNMNIYIYFLSCHVTEPCPILEYKVCTRWLDMLRDMTGS